MEHGSDVEWKDSTGSTPLIEAMKKINAIYYVQKLVEKNANVNYKTKFGDTPLHSAAFHGRDEAIRFLVSKGAEINIISNYGTPFD